MGDLPKVLCFLRACELAYEKDGDYTHCMGAIRKRAQETPFARALMGTVTPRTHAEWKTYVSRVLEENFQVDFLEAVADCPRAMRNVGKQESFAQFKQRVHDCMESVLWVHDLMDTPLTWTDSRRRSYITKLLGRDQATQVEVAIASQGGVADPGLRIFWSIIQRILWDRRGSRREVVGAVHEQRERPKPPKRDFRARDRGTMDRGRTNWDRDRARDRRDTRDNKRSKTRDRVDRNDKRRRSSSPRRDRDQEKKSKATGANQVPLGMRSLDRSVPHVDEQKNLP